VVIDISNTTFPINGDFTATVDIVDGANVLAGTITGVQAHLSDTPLTVGPFPEGRS